MNEKHEEMAANYVLGVLTQAERADIEMRMRDDAGFSGLVDAWTTRLAPLSDETQELAPPANLFSNIEQAINRQIASGSRASVTVRDNEGRWIEIAPGARKKFLYFDEHSRTEAYLIELDAGASLPEHEHTSTEDCLVISGEFILGDLKLKAGDFHAAFAVSQHAPCRSENGCRLFIKAAA